MASDDILYSLRIVRASCLNVETHATTPMGCHHCFDLVSQRPHDFEVSLKLF